MRAWRLRGIAFFVAFFVVSSALPLAWDPLLGRYRLIDATGLGTAWGALVGLLAADLGQYLWHRFMHSNAFLWRWFHQMHHSAERIDVAGAFVFSPLDMVGFTLVGSLSLVLIVGVTAEAAVIVIGISTLLALFQHANLRTPQWLGYIVQRPENHSVHHQRGVHAYNYGSLSLWDILLGTFKNPKEWEGAGGFFDGSSDRVADMLLGRDIAAEHAARTEESTSLAEGNVALATGAAALARGNAPLAGECVASGDASFAPLGAENVPSSQPSPSGHAA